MKLQPIEHNCPTPTIEQPRWLNKAKVKWRCDDCGVRWFWFVTIHEKGNLSGTIRKRRFSHPSRKWRRIAKHELEKMQRFGE